MAPPGRVTHHVISLLSQGRISKVRNPSITTRPDMVPVRVEIWPAANRATANAMIGLYCRLSSHS